MVSKNDEIDLEQDSESKVASKLDALFTNLSLSEKQKLIAGISLASSSSSSSASTSSSSAANDEGLSSGDKMLSFMRGDLPRLPTFSGDGKGEISYNLWRYELKCISDDSKLSTSAVWQAIRRSLKGIAAEAAMNLGESATVDTLISKFDVLFGNIQSLEQLLQKFYMTNQGEQESITSWGCRIEDVMTLINRQGSFNTQVSRDMLRSKFWSGLHSEYVKSAIRHKFDAGDSFEELLRMARIVEMEHTGQGQKKQTSQPAKTQHQPQVIDNNTQKLDEILKQLRSLDGRIQKLEKHQPSNPARVQNKVVQHEEHNQGTQPTQQKPRTFKKDFRRSQQPGKRICHECGDPSHIRPNCPKLQDKSN